MNDGSVTKAYVVRDTQWGSRWRMNNTAVLNVHARTDADRSNVAADDNMVHYGAPITDCHVTADVSRRCNVNIKPYAGPRSLIHKSML